MKAFGYARADEEADAPMELREVSFVVTADELNDFVAFLDHVRNDPARKGTGESTHFHYRDWSKKWNRSGSDIIILLKY